MDRCSALLLMLSIVNDAAGKGAGSLEEAESSWGGACEYGTSVEHKAEGMKGVGGAEAGGQAGPSAGAAG